MVINHLLAGKILQVVVGEGFPRIPHESWSSFVLSKIRILNFMIHDS